MDKNKIALLKTIFDKNAHQTDNGVEYWTARELQQLLGYIEWRKFEGTIIKAKKSCELSGFEVSDHFVETAKMVNICCSSFTQFENDVIL